jgi:hypothetical protein
MTARERSFTVDDRARRFYSLPPFADYCRFCTLGGFGGAAAVGALGGTAAVASAGAALLLPPNITRLGLRSKLFTARLMSERVRRPSVISAPDRLSKSSAISRI